MVSATYEASGGQSLCDAVDWLKGLALGSAGITIAVLAIASIGLMMLSGYLPVRRSGRTILGCFILFSAGTIANGLVSASALAPSDVPVSAPVPAYEPAEPKPVSYDPYEGAAAPVRHQHDLLE